MKMITKKQYSSRANTQNRKKIFCQKYPQN